MMQLPQRPGMLGLSSFNAGYGLRGGTEREGRWTTKPLNPEQKKGRKEKRKKERKASIRQVHHTFSVLCVWQLQPKILQTLACCRFFLADAFSTSSHILQVPSGLVRARRTSLHRQSRPLSSRLLPPRPGSEWFGVSSLQFLPSQPLFGQKERNEWKPQQLLLLFR